MRQIPSDVQSLFSLPPLPTSPQHNVTFHALLQTLSAFVSDPSGPGTLPISATLPDMKSDTENYVRLQNLYRAQAEEEKVITIELPLMPASAHRPTTGVARTNLRRYSPPSTRMSRSWPARMRSTVSSRTRTTSASCAGSNGAHWTRIARRSVYSYSNLVITGFSTDVLNSERFDDPAT